MSTSLLAFSTSDDLGQVITWVSDKTKFRYLLPPLLDLTTRGLIDNSQSSFGKCINWQRLMDPIPSTTLDALDG